MRQIVLDTETTGLSWEKGNRVVEIGCLELLERRPTGNHFHRYLNPDREMEQGAQEVTGLTVEFLADKPRFAEVVDEFIEFVAGAELIIHNAAFDLGFLDYELSLAGSQYGRLRDHCGVLDTLALARQRYPGQRNSLDALCKRLGVDNGHRKLHGALLDAELLADVYLALTGGQREIELAPLVEARLVQAAAVTSIQARPRRVLRASADELAQHDARLEKIAAKSGGKLVWPRASES
ncbi:MAG TPA: DNA polymerase III subunit epsilon [Arenimonas sp.]|nr:DNA polymerase III subunit epsilon [Arenimonas sp.]